MTKQPYIFTREGTRLIPAEPWTAERLDGFPEGVYIKAATLTRPRSLPFQGFYWVHLSNIIKATECAATPDHLHKALLKLSGYTAPVYNSQGKIIELVEDSTAFDKMDQDEFYAYVEKAKFALANHLGIVWDDYDEYGTQQPTQGME